MKRKQKTDRQKAVDKADTAWANAVKRKFKYRCQKPGCKKLGGVFNAHHAVLTRDEWGVRYDVNNGLCLHAGCHKYWAHVKTEQCRDVTLAIIGTEEFRRIKGKGGTILKYSVQDLLNIAKQLDEMYKDVENPKEKQKRTKSNNNRNNT